MAELALREEQELVSAAAGELTKLRRQLRQARNDLSCWTRSNKKVIERQERAILQLEKEHFDSQMKWMAVKEAQKPPKNTIDQLVERYHHAELQAKESDAQLRMARDLLYQVQHERQNRKKPTPPGAEEPSRMREARRKLDQVMIKYNRILASNSEFRLQLEEMMREKEEFNRHLQQLQQDRTLVNAGLDKLYDETAALYQQREEFRLKLNLLRDRLEKTRSQGQRELREYRRLLTNDQKMNHFLAQKNKIRPDAEQQGDQQAAINDAHQQISEEQMSQKDMEEWIDVTVQRFGHSNFESVVDQYLHDLEHGYVLYGLIAQKNNEIDQLEEKISLLEQQFDQFPQPISKSGGVKFNMNENQQYQVLNHLLSQFRSIMNAVNLTFNFTRKGDPETILLDWPELLEECALGCELLSERIGSLLSLTRDPQSPVQRKSVDLSEFGTYDEV